MELGQFLRRHPATTANIVADWWDNGGSGNESFALFNRNTGAIIQ